MSEKFYAPALAVIGVGLIGGSLALGLKQRGMAGKIFGAGRSQKSLRRAHDLGVIDEICESPAAAAARADVIVLAAPVGACAELFAAIAPVISAEKTVTDVGSVKSGICEAAGALGEHARRFVPAHPVAGREHSGAHAASANLFENHAVALTPRAGTDADAVNTVTNMWRALGARVVQMDAAEHDRVLALTSHLPHVLAYAMVDCFARAGDHARADMSAGGFYDFTRTASSDAEMWRDICVMNRVEIMRQIEIFQVRLTDIGQLIMRAEDDENDESDALKKLFAAAKKTRAQIKDRRARD